MILPHGDAGLGLWLATMTCSVRSRQQPERAMTIATQRKNHFDLHTSAPYHIASARCFVLAFRELLARHDADTQHRVCCGALMLSRCRAAARKICSKSYMQCQTGVQDPPYLVFVHAVIPTNAKDHRPVKKPSYKSSTNKQLLWWDEVPPKLQFNPYIASGYRANLSYKRCMCTFFALHNETCALLPRPWAHSAFLLIDL